MSKAKESGQDECIETGSDAELVIVANDEVREALSELTKPSVQVVVNGRVVNNDEGQSVLVIDQIATQVNKSLGIVATDETRETLASLSASQGDVQVTIVGEVLEHPGRNVLVLDNVVKSRSLPIVVEEKIHNRIAELATTEGGEVPVKAKVVCDNGHKYLVLES